MDTTIILPERFKHPRYMGGAWMDQARYWSEEDLTLLAAASDLRIAPEKVASTLGRAPNTIVRAAMDRGYWVPREWRARLPQRPKKAKLLNLEYPYIVKPDDRHADLIAVNRLVSKELPGREDVCQDIMLALWQSRTSLDELKNDPKAIRAFVRAFRKQAFERGGFGVESMDVTLHSDDGDGKSKYEDARFNHSLYDDEDDTPTESIFNGARGKRSSRDRTFEQVLRDEEELGVPAAFWVRAEHIN